ncbi:zinc finger protein RTS2 [Cylindrobasidium torrendii FP15055 ss-10]|uniref:Zinc finger protein RTS2 n=1 Tax=Cylindrobasidium torrendii FP15055 ss-10 TaxID=1314674 RepID=A0A0D7BET5_9AGAR|nr:zinc finger protein RTS2 [Cylindrobasidium torrendii FP15055 ss-10]
MPRAEAGTPKDVANRMKSKGLQRLRWFCQVCEKQCRDENGFKCHAQSESHLRQMLVVGENAGKHINNFSMEFQSEFVKMLSRRFGTKRVLANRVYQEYISDKNHLHMNSTRWVTLTEFCKHLGRAGIVRVDETEKGWFIAWIDNSPKALEKAEASQKKDRMTSSDEQRERILIAEQIERAKAQAPEQTTPPPVASEGLKRDDTTEKVTISLAKPAAATVLAAETKPALSLKPAASNPLKLNPLKANPLKKTNVFKTASTNDKKRSLSAAESLIAEDQERKKRRLGGS